ncbi:MAG: prephenate dehydrogenase/arogenate dehydrogenase family protein [Pirellulales bacterium]
MILDTVAIVGVGLLGGSVGAALRERRLAKTLIGIGRSAETLAEAKTLGIVDHTTDDLESGVRTANLVVVATPVDTIADLVERIKAATSAGTLITDCGSTKASIVKRCTAKNNSGPRFVGSHPLAGGEKTGPGRPGRFVRRSHRGRHARQRPNARRRSGPSDRRTLGGVGCERLFYDAGRTRQDRRRHQPFAARRGRRALRGCMIRPIGR